MFSGVLDPRGPVAAAERLILINATAIMIAVVVPVILMTLAFAWWYRASNTRARYRPEWTYSGQIELVVWAVPALVVVLLAGVAWIGAHALDPYRPLTANVAPLRIQVISLDWKWLFIYPDERVAALNQLIVPVDTPLDLTLTSATVMNAFFVPQLGSQIYTMPGMTTQLHLQAAQVGSFPGLSSHYSGDGFADMHFAVRVMPRSEYAQWLTATRAAAAPLTPAEYGLLLMEHGTALPRVYGHVQTALFPHILELAAPREPRSRGAR